MKRRKRVFIVLIIGIILLAAALLYLNQLSFVTRS